MNTYRHIPLRRTTDELLILQARARRERNIAFWILVGTITAFVVLVVELARGF